MSLCSLNSKAKAFTEGVGMNSLEESMIGSLFKRQLSDESNRRDPGTVTWQEAARLSEGLIRQPSSDEVAQDSAEPDCEPDVDDLDLDVDQFQTIPAPARQMSIMSNYSAKAPSRQVTAMSNFSEQDWGPLGFKRQQTEECWPTWNDKQPQSDIGQFGSLSLGSEQTFVPCLSSLLAPYASAGSLDMRPIFAQDDGADQFQFRRKRESLIDLAKQQQEQEQEAGKSGGAKKPIPAKFCPFCGGNVQPAFRFCVFCGAEVPLCS